MRTVIAFLSLVLSVTSVSAKPNFIVILTDDQEDTGSMAYMPKVHSLLAEHGLTFTNSFVNFSMCCPSRVSLLTGQSAHNHGVKTNNWKSGKGGWPAFKDKEGNSLPVWLKAAGYQTALIGKYLNGYGKAAAKKRVASTGKDRGDDKQKKSTTGAWTKWLGRWWYGPEKPVEPRKTVDRQARRAEQRAQKLAEKRPITIVPPGWDLWFVFAKNSKYYDYQINENGELLDFGDQASDYSTDVIRDRAIRFIKEHPASQPFFMLITPKAPHGQGALRQKGPAISAPRHSRLFADVTLPKNPAFNEDDVNDKPPRMRRLPSLDSDATDKLEKFYRAELQSLQAIDDMVEAIVNALQSARELDDTFIIFTSDNGLLFGEHRWTSKKNVPYEGSIRVPFVVRGPGVAENETRSQLVNNLDVVATIEQLAGVTPGVVPDGRSLVPLFADANALWRSAIQFEGGAESKSPCKRFVGVRTATKKYVKYDDGFEELYDLSADPYELENKASDASYASDLASLRAINDRLKDCAGESCWVP